MLDHIGFGVSDFVRAKDFYTKALAPLGYRVVMEVINPQESGGGAYAGFGDDRKPCFWIGTGPRLSGQLHVAFAAKDRAAVDAFYRAAIGAGGTDNGKPGLRPYYHPNYYGAFVLDPDGHNVEAVCHAAE